MQRWGLCCPLHIISELGVADLMRDGPISVDALANKTDTHAPTLFRILRALSSVGILIETEDRVFGLTSLARCLLSNALRPIARMFLSEWHDKAWNGLSHTARTGKPGFDYTFGKPSFSMNTNSRLLIIEYIIEPGSGFSVAKLLDLEVLVMGGGRERTIEEYKDLLDTAGVAFNNNQRSAFYRQTCLLHL